MLSAAKLARQVPRRTWRWVRRVTVVALLVPILLQCVIAYLIGSDARILPPQLLAAKNLLVVTAHPDDECLFFAPSILGTLDGNPDIKGALLVMSTGALTLWPATATLTNTKLGNNYGQGKMRTNELQGSCEALGIHPTRCVAIDHPELQDNPKVWWNTKLIEAIVHEHVSKWNIDAVRP
jgi:N-acetylglucosaminylphosphatidylinositol deacetylase